MNYNDELKHYGVLGMKWGIRHDPVRETKDVNRRLKRRERQINSLRRKSAKLERKSTKNELRAVSGFRTEFSDARMRKAIRQRAKAKKYSFKAERKIQVGQKIAKKYLNLAKDIPMDNIDQKQVDYIKEWARTRL